LNFSKNDEHLIINLAAVVGGVCHERKGIKVLFPAVKKMGVGPHIRLAGGVCKPLHSAVIKSYGIER
jgi:hypothetical protein